MKRFFIVFLLLFGFLFLAENNIHAQTPNEEISCNDEFYFNIDSACLKTNEFRQLVQEHLEFLDDENRGRACMPNRQSIAEFFASLNDISDPNQKSELIWDTLLNEQDGGFCGGGFKAQAELYILQNCGCQPPQGALGSAVTNYRNIVNQKFAQIVLSSNITISNTPVPIPTDLVQPTAIVTNNPSFDPNKINSLIDRAAEGCGIQGLQCCTPTTEALPDPSINSDDNLNIVFKILLDVVKSFIPISDIQDQATAEVYQATDTRLCTGTLQPEIVVNGNKSIIENKYDIESSSYFRNQCTGTISVGYTCKDIPISSDTVESCTCVSETGDDEINATIETDLTAGEIQNQICKITNTAVKDAINQDCKSCLERGQFWSINGNCVDQDKAKQELKDKIIHLRSEDQSGIKLEDPKIASVLSAHSDDIDEEIEIYLNSTCGGSAECNACLLRGWFFSSGGCTNYEVNTAHFRALCKNVSENEYSDCISCAYNGKMWTAIGCVDLDLQKIIQEEIFGWGLGLAGMATLLCIIYSAFMLQTSANNPERIAHAQEMMTSCITGLIVIIFSVFILNIIGVDILRIPGFTRGSSAEAEDSTLEEPQSIAVASIAPNFPTSIPTRAPIEASTNVLLTAIPTQTPLPTVTLTPTVTQTPTPVPPIGRGLIRSSSILYQVGGITNPLGEGEEVILYAITSDGNYLRIGSSGRIGWVAADSVNYDPSILLPNEELPYPVPLSTFTPTPTFSPTPSTVAPVATSTPIPVLTPTPTDLPPRNTSLQIYECEKDPNDETKYIGPQNDEIYLWDNLNYSGKCVRLAVGQYDNLKDVQNPSTGFSLIGNTGRRCNSSYNDCISSIQIGKAVNATVYVDPNASGCSLTLNDSIDNLDKVGSSCTGRNFVTDKISSVIVKLQ